MFSLLIKVLPLQLASMLSPGIFALSIFLITKKEYILGRLLSLLLGSALVAIVLGVIGLQIGQNVTLHTNNIIKGTIDFVFATLFLYFGITSLFKPKDEKKKESVKEDNSRQFLKWLAIGFVISITNFDAVLLNFSAAKEIGVAGAVSVDKIILIIIGILLFTAPILIPLIFYLIWPKIAQKILNPLNVFLMKYGRYLVAVIFLIFAIFLIYRGIKII